MLALAAVLFVAGVSFLSFPRQYFHYGTETDFLTTFLPETQRFLNADPLRLPTHPPAYPIAVGLLNMVIGDWGTTGRLISLAAAVVVMVSGYLVFLSLWGSFAARGAVLSLAASSVFLHYASVSTSDMFFTALFWFSVLLSLRAIAVKSPWAWFVSGLFVGLTLLSRTNAVVAIPLLLGVWLPGETSSKRRRFTLAALCGFLAPLSSWALYAALTGSALTPRATHVNLALTYFAGDTRVSREAIEKVAHFDSMLDVLLHDPVRMARTYTRDLALLMFQLPSSLVLPLQLFFAPGLFFLLTRPLSQRAVLLLAVVGFSVLLNNLKAFEGRFYLYLLPLFGAGVGEIYHRAVTAATSRWMRTALKVVFVIVYLASLPMAARQSYRQLYGAQQEISEAISAAERLLEKNAVIVARMPVVAHHVGAEWIYLPEMDGIETLREFLRNQDDRQPLYVYFGSIERRHRPGLRSLAEVEHYPEWLRLVAQESNADPWILYRYDP